MPNKPVITIGLSVFNGGKTLSAAVRSIIGQTFTEWELVVTDDASTDDSLAVLENFSDPRIKVVKCEENRGLAFRLNQIVEMAEGKYFARMDQDDISFPERIEKQVRYMEKHPEIDLSGTGILVYRGEGLILGRLPVAEKHGEICRYPWKGFYLPHPTWLGRTEWFRRHRYSSSADKAEDQHLLFRTFRHSRFACLPEVLLGYREEPRALRKMLAARHVFFKSFFREAFIRGWYIMAAGMAFAQALKAGGDILNIVSGIKIFRNPLLPLNGELRREWNNLWEKVVGHSSQSLPKIIYFVAEDWFFCSHFLDRAVAARRDGYRVIVAARVGAHGGKITSHGLRLIPINLLRRGMNPFRELEVIWKLIRLYKSERPDIVHHVALKPIFYGSIAARVAGVPVTVNAPVGMGYAFSSQRWKARLLRPLVTLIYRFLLNPSNSHVILENPDDRRMLTDIRIVRPERTSLIRGSGVDLRMFPPAPEPQGKPVVILASRMLWDKGVAEFVQAAQRLRAQGVLARFVLVGDSDTGNPAAIPMIQLQVWQNSGVVEWWGHRDDMQGVFAQSHIICLPSYREGLPKVLLEAAACSRPIVATNVPGCREIVRDGVNGLLVPVRDAVGLAAALRRMIEDAKLRRVMGACGREIAEKEFSNEKVISETLAVYRKLRV
ncbi:MAG: glycosyltransferase [bacterium]